MRCEVQATQVLFSGFTLMAITNATFRDIIIIFLLIRSILQLFSFPVSLFSRSVIQILYLGLFKNLGTYRLCETLNLFLEVTGNLF